MPDCTNASDRLGECQPRILLSRRQPRNLQYRPDFHGPLASPGNSASNADGFVEVLGIDQEIPPQVLARFGTGSVGHEPLPFPHANAGRRRYWMNARGAQEWT